MRNRSGFGWLELIAGICLILLGIFTLAKPNLAMSGLVILFGLLAVIIGIKDIIFYVKVEEYTGFGPMLSLVSGILSVMAGISIVIHPDAGKWIISLLLPIWFIAHCISRLCHFSPIRRLTGRRYYYFTLIVNILGIILGCLLILMPWVTLISVSCIISIYLILLGIEGIITAFSGLGNRW